MSYITVTREHRVNIPADCVEARLPALFALWALRPRSLERISEGTIYIAMTMQSKSPPAATPPSPGERVWRNSFFFLSALLAGLALVKFDAGRWAHGVGDLGASVLMLSVMVQFPFLRALIRASADDEGSPERIKRRRAELVQQAEQLKAANPWSDVAGRAGWILLGISLILRIVGAP